MFSRQIPIAPERFVIDEQNHRLSIPFYATHPIQTPGEAITHLLVIVHDEELTAGSSFQWGRLIVERSGFDKAAVMVVAPQFVEKRGALKEPGALFWDPAWKNGAKSLSIDRNQGLPALSSFEILDRLLLSITAEGPIRHISVCGHSGGGQFVLRYAALNRIHSTLKARGIQIQYAAANPPSYLYLDRSRFSMTASGAILHTSATNLEGCADYNRYPYGLEDFNRYAGTLSAGIVRNRLLNRPTLFLLGAQATRRKKGGLDRSCSADFQGRNRYERGILYRHHLQAYGPSADPSIHQWLVVPDAGNDATDMFIVPRVSAAIMGIR